MNLFTMASIRSRWVWQMLSLLVTALCIVYVLQGIHWHDGLDVEHQRLVGSLEFDAEGHRIFCASKTGETFLLDGPSAVPGRYTPGMGTLFRNVHLGCLSLALVAAAVPIVLMGLRWSILLNAEQLAIGPWEAVRLTWLGTFAGNFLPGSTGTDLAKVVCVCRRSPQKKIAATTTVFVSRLIGLVTLLVIGAIALLGHESAELAGSAHGVWISLLICAVGTYFLLSERWQRSLRLEEIFTRLPGGAKLLHLQECFLHYRSRKGVLAWCVAISFSIQFFSVGCVWLLGLALGIDVAVLDYYMLMPVIFIAGAATPAINGLGVREGAFQILFVAVGVSPDGALALAILHRCVGLLISLPGALPFYREVRAVTSATATPEESESCHAAAERSRLVLISTPDSPLDKNSPHEA
jgi:uncharacterized protein (TIRG00374 family)